MRGRRPRVILMVFAWCLAAIEVGIWVGAPQFPRRIRTALRTNIAETSPTPEFPALRTRVYAPPPAGVFNQDPQLSRPNPANWDFFRPPPPRAAFYAPPKVIASPTTALVAIR